MNLPVLRHADIAAVPGISDISGVPDIPVIGPNSALFLDFDGTLVDLAAQPEAVVIPGDLVPLLQQLAQHLGGAVALVSGRKLTDLDHFLAPLVLPAAAEHGAHCRRADGSQVQADAPDLTRVVRPLLALADSHPGLRVEVKASGVALHYRQAPQLEGLARQVMQQAADSQAGMTLLSGKCVLELKPAHVSKGLAIADFMRLPPFAGRCPVFVGDDVTDEAGFAAVQALGGATVKVGDGHTLARQRLPHPMAVRRWLHAAVASFNSTL